MQALFWMAVTALTVVGGALATAALDAVVDMSALKERIGFGGEPEWME